MQQAMLKRVWRRFLRLCRHPLEFPSELTVRCANAADRASRLLYNSRRCRCNLCTWEGNRFASIVGNRWIGWHLACPRCGSLPRHRLLAHWLRAREPVPPGGRCLELGPVPGFRPFLEGLGWRYLSVDLESPVAMVLMDLMHPALTAASFDLVLCYHVLGHVPDAARLLGVMRELLRPGGRVLLQEQVLRIPCSVEYGPGRSPNNPERFRDLGGDLPLLLARCGFGVHCVRPEEVGVDTAEERRLGVVPGQPFYRLVAAPPR